MMNRMISILLTVVLVGTVAVVPTSAETIVSTPVELEPIQIPTGEIVPVAYTSDFDGYSNVVGVLNSDGTKTAYIFASPVDAAQVDSITGLVSPSTESGAEVAASTPVEAVDISDATVYSDIPDTNYGTEETLYVGEHPTRGYARTYIKFDLTVLGAGLLSYKNVLSASLNLSFYGFRTQENTNNPDPNLSAVFEMYLAKESWSESSVTWTNRPDYYGDIIGMSNYFRQTSDTYEDYLQDFYITQTVMGWLQGLPNYGIMIKEKDDRYEATFHSTEATDTSLQPYLTVTYTTQTAPTGQGINTLSQSYYIVNRQTGQCLTASSASSGSGLVVRTGDPAYTDRQIWHFASAGGAYYKIQLGSTGMYLCNSTAGIPTLGSFIGLPQDIWEVDRNWNGTYRFQNTLSTAQYLTTDSEDVYDVATVFQGDYICDMNHWDEWSLVPATVGSAAIMGMESDNNITTTYGMNTIASNLSTRNYSADVFVNQPASVGFTELQSSDFYFFSQHGLPGKLLFYEGMDGEEEISSSIVTAGAGDYSLLSLSDNALNRLRLVLLSSCESGADYVDGVTTDNMTGRMYWLGAHNVVSYFHNTGATVEGFTIGSTDMWNSYFMTDILLGRSLKIAKGRADGHVYEDAHLLTSSSSYVYDANVRHELGDDTYRPCYDMSTQSQTVQYEYNDIMQLTYSPEPSTSSSVYVENAINTTLAEKEFTLPLNGSGDEFDVYTDSDGGVYWYYKDTNRLHSYEPYTENLSLGSTVVNQEDALFLTETFLDLSTYDYTGFTVTTSNEFSKNYTVEYAKDNQRLVFHLQANDDGYAYIVDFAAHNYTGE